MYLISGDQPEVKERSVLCVCGVCCVYVVLGNVRFKTCDLFLSSVSTPWSTLCHFEKQCVTFQLRPRRCDACANAVCHFNMWCSRCVTFILQNPPSPFICVTLSYHACHFCQKTQ